MKPYMLAQADATRLPFADGAFDLVFTSPPYIDARTYGIGAQRDCIAWIDWMLDVVTELTRVCRGLVLVNCAGVTRNRIYQPGPEGLLYEWYKRGGHCWRPAYWYRVGIPGSGGKQWLRADIEYVLAFKRDGEWLEWSDNTANGHPPKWAPGGEMSYRLSTGERVNQRGHPSHQIAKARHTKSRPDGSDEIQYYTPPVKANPGCLVKVKVGGGLLGHPLAHENEAPFPVDLAKWFIRGWCPPGGKVLDPFSGSGTTVDAARQLGRIGVGCDLRMSQCELARRRLMNPVMKKPKRQPKPANEMTLFGAAT